MAIPGNWCKQQNESQTLVDLTWTSNAHPPCPSLSNITDISATNVSRYSNAPALDVFTGLQGTTLDNTRGLHRSLLDLDDSVPAPVDGQ